MRTSVFAWSETALQVAWVAGGALGIALPLLPPFGFGVVAAVLVALLTQAVRIRVRGNVRPSDAARAPDGRSVRLCRSDHQAEQQHEHQHPTTEITVSITDQDLMV